MDKDIILSIKNELNLVQVMDGIYFSDLVGNTLDIAFRNEDKTSFTQTLIEKLKQSLFIHRLSVVEQPNINLSFQGKPWYILSSGQTHFVEFMLPLKKVDQSLLTVMQKDNKLAQISLNTFAKSAIKEFKDWKKLRWDLLKSLVTDQLQSFQLTSNQLGLIFDQAEIGMIRVYNAKYYLSQYKPQFVLTEYDREFGTSPIIAAANHLGIPTGTMVHGSTYPIHNYWPPLARKVFTWGKKQSQHFLDAGLLAVRLIEAGSTRAKNQLKYTKEQVCEKLNIPLDLTYIVFISNNIELSQRLELINCFASENHKTLNIQLVLKLHPREHKSDYDALSLDVKRNLLILDSSQLNSDEAMVLGDAFVGHNSVMLLECLLMEKPVIIMDVISSSPGIGIELHSEANMPIARNSREWGAIAEQLSEQEYRNQLVNNSKAYNLLQCARRDAEAAQYILDAMNKEI